MTVRVCSAVVSRRHRRIGTRPGRGNQLRTLSSAWEIGNGQGDCARFLPAYSCQDGHWAKVRPMLTYAAKKAANPGGG